MEFNFGAYDWDMQFERSAGTGTVQADTRGLLWLDATDGDFYVGSGPIAPIYYSQGSTKASSTKTGYDLSEHASYFSQGYWGNGATPAAPFIECQFQIGDGSVGAYSMGADGTTYIRDGATTVGMYDSTATLGGGGLLLGARLNGAGAYLHFDEGNNRFLIRAMPGTKAANYISSIGLAGSQLTNFIPVTTATVSNGTSSNEWKDGSYSNDVRMRQVVCDGDSAGVASTNSLTGTSDTTANSTGVGTILFKGTTSRNSTGFIKIYVGTTAYYVPFFSAITG